MEAVVDNLIGGQTYRFDIAAVTEAGSGDGLGSEAVGITMPITGWDLKHFLKNFTFIIAGLLECFLIACII